MEAELAKEKQYCSDQVESYEIALSREVERAKKAEAERDALRLWIQENNPPMDIDEYLKDALSRGGKDKS